MQLAGLVVSYSQINSSLTDAGAMVRDILSGHGKASTSEQERRIAKTLERLRPAENGALPGPEFGIAAPLAPSFESVLVQLSHE